MNAAAYLLDNGLTTDKVALLTSEGDFTYSQLEKGVLSVAAYLRSEGISKGDRVLIVADSSFFWAASYLGIILT
ncbi:MAG: AMP-binding protein, partial [bacterium]|nr:AMP-binding protein [bacterium]